MKPTRENIFALIEPALEREGIELVDVECARMGSRWLIRLYLDREGGITLKDCADMSRLIGDILDVNDLPPGPYNLEVSSPGLDRPLTRDKDFFRFKGSKVKIRLRDKFEGSRNFKGILSDYIKEGDGGIVVIESDGKIYRLPKDNIFKANLDYEI
ncbi:MAG: ribosome maturation factor RimP [Syntrophaceae bacterium]